MYLWEWLFYDNREPGDYERWKDKAEKRARETGKPVGGPNVRESVSNTVTDGDSIYTHNDTYIDVRTPHDEKRGLVTLFIGGGLFMLIWFFILVICMFVMSVLTGHAKNGQIMTLGGYIAFAFPIFVFPCVIFIYVKYLFRYLRLESFTARRIIVRFNRVTRKVYLLRPKNIGGIAVLDWDQTQAAVDPSMRHEVLPGGGILILGWEKGAIYDVNGHLKDDYEITFVGRTARNGAELLAFWEYIRRYMEIGPEAAPPPKKLLSKTPWPWLSFEAAWNILPLRGLHESGMWPMFVLVKLMLLPVTLIHATGHWISLLLCYEPKFPPSIENAGK
ncbi:hypothetical protein FHX57_004628 [Paraburkholderia tropica]|uniref:DUF6708 domain-containing protein n=3 Tax=Paraburkholderia tropica TaxID=92647 RepID=UPI00160B8F8C|nr:DUF6708 domain-containing protein [Paraburkholderia tropica]MBB3002261.1 hypothetical protein [Paraburkholderia tropica]MBB6321649.1 hypothetical protein [Paraburkholderia tropica]